MDKRIYEKAIWWLWDYNNELMRVGFALKKINGYSPALYKLRKIKKLTEYMKGELRMVVNRDTPKEDISLFWKKKKRLDILIEELNQEFSKDTIDETLLKKLFNEVCMIVFTTEADYSKHTPFPEATT